MNVSFKPAEQFREKAQEVFEGQKRRILELIPNADIQHVGSTAVPGTLTKGDLDITVRVEVEEFDQAVNALKSLYELNQPENWSDVYASFKSDKVGMDFGAQLVVKDSEHDFFLKQRDILIQDSDLREEYNAIKLKFEGKDMEKYREKKGEFFEKLILL